LNGSYDSSEVLSAFSVKTHIPQNRSSLKTSWQSSTFSHVGSTEEGDTKRLGMNERRMRSKAYKGKSDVEKKSLKAEFDKKKADNPTVQRTRKHRLKPNPSQHSVLMMWMKDARLTYNWALEDVIKNKLYLRRDFNFEQ
jgi:hypothetical protein